MIQVVVVDDHPIVRSEICAFLKRSADIEILGQAATGAEGLQLAEILKPDVLLLDIELPDIPGSEIVRLLHERQDPVKILALSGYDDSILIHELLEMGASGYLLKDDVPEAILKGVRKVASGEKDWVSPLIENRRSKNFKVNGDREKLTSREMDVLRKMVTGKTNTQIANELGISPKTVEKYTQTIFEKLNVVSRAEAVVYALREGLL